MRRMLLLLTLLSLAGPAPVRAQSFSIDVDGIGAFPLGRLASGRRAADMTDAGFGIKAEALYDLTQSVAAGLGIAGVFQRSELVVLDTRFEADMTTLPVYALVRAHGLRARFAPYGEAGLGLTSWSLRPRGLGGGDTHTQVAFSFLAGLGASWELSPAFGLRLGTQYHQAISGSGEVWKRHDDPKMLLLSVGARYRY